MSKERREIDQVHTPFKGFLDRLHKKKPLWYDKPSVSMGMGRRGQPDFTVLINGILFGIEAKHNLRLKNGEITTSKSKLPNANQTKRLREIKTAGGYGLVMDINNMEYVKDLLKMVSENENPWELFKMLRNFIEINELDIELYATEIKEVTI